MRKALTLAVITLLLSACAANKNIVMLKQKQVEKMSAEEVTSFYSAKNKDLLGELIYDHGGSSYDGLVTIFNNMNKELTALGKLNTTKDNYYARLERMVKKYRGQVTQAVK